MLVSSIHNDALKAYAHRCREAEYENLRSCSRVRTSHCNACLYTWLSNTLSLGYACSRGRSTAHRLPATSVLLYTPCILANASQSILSFLFRSSLFLSHIYTCNSLLHWQSWAGCSFPCKVKEYTMAWLEQWSLWCRIGFLKNFLKHTTLEADITCWLQTSKACLQDQLWHPKSYETKSAVIWGLQLYSKRLLKLIRKH